MEAVTSSHPPSSRSTHHLPFSPAISVVTGGAGFIGRHLVQLLLDRGHRVRVIDVQEPTCMDARVEYVQGSILDNSVLRKVMDGAQYVFHLAANPNLWAADKREFSRLNFHGTRAVLEVAAQANVLRVVHTSTESILKGRRKSSDRVVNEQVVRTLEDMPGPYCRSKYQAEQAALTAANNGVPVVIVNPTLPVGPGDYLMTPPTRMLMDYVNGVNPGYVDFEMNLVDVRDVAMGHLLAAERGRIGERYILGGENVRLSQVLRLLEDLTGLPMTRRHIPYGVALGFAAVSEWIADRITHRSPRASLTGVRVAGASMIFDCSKAVQELGLPQTPVSHAIAEGILFLRDQGKTRPFGEKGTLNHWNPKDDHGDGIRLVPHSLVEPGEKITHGPLVY